MATTLTPLEQATEKVREQISDKDLERMTSYTLADAIREGSSVTTQAYNWGNGETACALTAAAIAAKARGYLS